MASMLDDLSAHISQQPFKSKKVKVSNFSLCPHCEVACEGVIAQRDGGQIRGHRWSVHMREMNETCQIVWGGTL